MSFAFPKPVPESRTSSSVSSSYFDIDEHYKKLMEQRGPDYDELTIPLSVYAYFNRVFPSEQLEEIRRRHNVNVNVEESDFTERFKKLNYSAQQKFLSKFLQKFKHERLISSFKQLDAEHRQQLIESMNHLTPEENFRDPWETEEEFRLRRFTQLCRDHTWDVQKLTWESEDEQEDNSDWKSCFFEFFVGFSIIWFKGQWASGQDMLIEQLSKGVRGSVMIEERRLQDDETEEDFKLRRFTELCKKIVDFRVQVKFLDNAQRKLEKWGDDHFSARSILEPQEHDRAAELLCQLSTLGCSLLSANYQRHKIEEMSKLVEGGVTIIEESSDGDHFRMTRFTELFNQVPVLTRINLFNQLRKILLKEKPYSEAVGFFRGLGSEDQTEMIEDMSYEIIMYNPGEKWDLAELIIEKFSGESEEDFRLRRFKKVCGKHLSTFGYIIWPDAYEERVGQGTSDNYDESSPNAKFLFDASITWFKARCANYRRNPIHVILFGEVEFPDHVIEKLPEESEEDFRLRRFTESFKRLEFTSQVRIVDYIQHTLFGDLGHPDLYDSCPHFVFQGERLPSEGRDLFDSEWIKMKLPDLQDQGAAAAATTTSQGATTTTSQAATTTTSQAGGGGQGTGQP